MQQVHASCKTVGDCVFLLSLVLLPTPGFTAGIRSRLSRLLLSHDPERGGPDVPPYPTNNVGPDLGDPNFGESCLDWFESW